MYHIPVEPPPFFHRGPSPLTRLLFFGLLSMALLFADTRFRYLEGIRQVVAVVLFPLQRAVQFPGEALSYIGTYFSWIVFAARSMRPVGMIAPGKGCPVSGSFGLLADCEKSPARSSAVGTTAVLR